MKYDRHRDIPNHFAVYPSMLAPSIEARERLVAFLEWNCRRETQRGLAGHWSYSIAKHDGMLTCYRMELAELRALKEAASKANGGVNER